MGGVSPTKMKTKVQTYCDLTIDGTAAIEAMAAKVCAHLI